MIASLRQPVLITVPHAQCPAGITPDQVLAVSDPGWTGQFPPCEAKLPAGYVHGCDALAPAASQLLARWLRAFDVPVLVLTGDIPRMQLEPWLPACDLNRYPCRQTKFRQLADKAAIELAKLGNGRIRWVDVHSFNVGDCYYGLSWFRADQEPELVLLDNAPCSHDWPFTWYLADFLLSQGVDAKVVKGSQANDIIVEAKVDAQGRAETTDDAFLIEFNESLTWDRLVKITGLCAAWLATAPAYQHKLLAPVCPA